MKTTITHKPVISKDRINCPLVRPGTLGATLRTIAPSRGRNQQNDALPDHKAEYNQNILTLLDNLSCPILLLPRTNNGNVIKRIGFFADIRVMDIPTLFILTKIAAFFNAEIEVINLSNNGLPEMDHAYARSYFQEKGMSFVNGTKINLVNVGTNASSQKLATLIAERQIDTLAATQSEKGLLFRLAS